MKKTFMQFNFEFSSMSKALLWLETLVMRMKELDELHSVTNETTFRFSYEEGLLTVSFFSEHPKSILEKGIPSFEWLNPEPENEMPSNDASLLLGLTEESGKWNEQIFHQDIDFDILSSWLKNLLEGHNITCIGDLLALKKREFFGWYRAGKKQWSLIEDYLTDLGYKPECLPPDWRNGVKTQAQMQIEKLWTSIDDVDMPKMERLRERLIDGGCTLLGDVLAVSKSEVLSWRGAGPKTWWKLCEFAESLGFKANSLPKDWYKLSAYQKN